MAAVQFNNPFQRLTEVGWDNLLCIRFDIDASVHYTDGASCNPATSYPTIPQPAQGWADTAQMDFYGDAPAKAWRRANGAWSSIGLSGLTVNRMPDMGATIAESYAEWEYSTIAGDGETWLTPIAEGLPALANIPLPDEAISTAGDVFDGGDRFNCILNLRPPTGSPYCFWPGGPGIYDGTVTYEMGSPVVASTFQIKLFQIDIAYQSKLFECIGSYFESYVELSQIIKVYALLKYAGPVTG